MERLFNKYTGPWESPSGEHLHFSEEWPKPKDKPATRVTWEVNTFAEKRPKGYAAIEVYERASDTTVDFMDGYYPSPVGDREPIGPAFQEFAKWVIREVWPKETNPTPAELGPFYIPMTLRQFERKLETFVEQRTWQPSEGVLLKPPMWWRSGPEDIREADEIALLCDPFQGLALELDQKEVDSLVVVIRPGTYEEAIMEPPPDDAAVGYFEGFTATPIATVTGKWTRDADSEAHAALSAWLQSLGELAEPTPAQDVESGVGKKERSSEFELDSLRRQLDAEQENLLLIRERKSQYVLETYVPLPLVKEERRLQKHIEELERRIAERVGK